MICTSVNNLETRDRHAWLATEYSGKLATDRSWLRAEGETTKGPQEAPELEAEPEDLKQELSRIIWNCQKRCNLSEQTNLGEASSGTLLVILQLLIFKGRVHLIFFLPPLNF